MQVELTALTEGSWVRIPPLVKITKLCLGGEFNQSSLSCARALNNQKICMNSQSLETVEALLPRY